MESNPSPYLKHLYVCENERPPGQACCAARGSEAIRAKLKAFVKENGLQGKVRISASGCMDLCAKGANVMVYPEYRWYHGVTMEDVDRIIEEQLAPLVPLVPASSLRSGTIPIKAFLFDLGNVLVRFDHMSAARKIVEGTGAAAQELFDLFFGSSLVTDHDEGRISTRAFYEEIKKAIRMDIPFERFLEVWTHIFTPDEAMFQLAKRLLAQTPCYLISNTCRPHFDYLRTLCPVLEQFSGWILSYEVGALKPAPIIYHRALELIRQPAREIFYIDDREDLIDAGKRLGFQTHRFVNYETLMEALRDRGIEVAALH